jgi:hypothetical protein
LEDHHVAETIEQSNLERLKILRLRQKLVFSKLTRQSSGVSGSQNWRLFDARFVMALESSNYLSPSSPLISKPLIRAPRRVISALETFPVEDMTGECAL